MKNWIIVGIVIFSLLGLIFVQYRFLRAGLLLERTRLDQRMTYVLDEVYLKLYRETPIREMALRVLVSEKEPLSSPEFLLNERLRDSFDILIRQYLGRDSTRMDYAFALTDGRQNTLFLATEDYVPEAEKQLSYQRRIGGLLTRACSCTPVFYLNIKNTVNYLLGRLAYLVIPSIVFIILLAVCLILLIVYLNRQRKLDQIKNDFINNLTHELKTPVFSIGMLSRMIKKSASGVKKEKVLEYANLIERENEVIKGHVERVLELASLEGRNFQMEKTDLSVHALLMEIVEAFRPKLQAQGGVLALQLDAQIDEVTADPIHMRNVIQNLLDNALKYHKGKVEIVLATRNEGQSLVISIADNGIGIAPDQQQKIFEKFYRVPSGDLHQVKGFGLGLNYVQQIVKAHKGQVKLFSKLGEGSKFEISLMMNGK